MKLFLLVAFSILAGTTCADSASDLKHARRFGADARIVLRCVDQVGLIVTNANVSSSLFPDGSFETAIGKDGLTDGRGCFIMEGKTNGEYAYEIKKQGYYRTFEDRYLFKDPSVFVSGGRWQPYGATNTVVLKRIVNPVAMYVEPYTRTESICHAVLCNADMLRKVTSPFPEKPIIFGQG